MRPYRSLRRPGTMPCFPGRVEEALGQLVGAAREGLLGLSVEVGLGVLRELVEEEVEGVVGPKGRWNRERSAVRHGHEDGEVTLGGRRVQVRRPRVRTADGESEVSLATYDHFVDRDPLEGVVLERMLAGVWTRQYGRAQEPVGERVETDARSTSKSAVSRTFVRRTRDQLWRLMNRPLSDLSRIAQSSAGAPVHTTCDPAASARRARPGFGVRGIVMRGWLGVRCHVGVPMLAWLSVMRRAAELDGEAGRLDAWVPSGFEATCSGRCTVKKSLRPQPCADGRGHGVGVLPEFVPAHTTRLFAPLCPMVRSVSSSGRSRGREILLRFDQPLRRSVHL